jgi:hypothetical protein
MLGDVDLATAKGLETVTHHGPSTIGIDTVYRSECSIPEAFLRGAGVPEGLISYVCSLAGQPIRFYSHFISYSSADRGFAEQLHAHLRAKDVRCWLIPESAEAEEKAQTHIDESIRLYDRLLVVLSEHSISSQWMEQEVTSALAKEHSTGQRVLFLLRLDDGVMEADSGWARDALGTRHVVDFRQWQDHDAYDEAFGRLLRDLETPDREGP